jgi:Fur family ferric uptake transcriptional regulator
MIAQHRLEFTAHNGGEQLLESQDLRKAGLKVTLPRMRILELLEANEARHVSAEDVYKILLDAGDDIGLATVYRVLTQFEAAGLITRHNFEGGHSVFELNRGKHHDHIVCNQCGEIVEFVDETIERCQRQVAQKAGFDIRHHSLIIYGDCTRPNCPNLPG